MPYYSIHLEAAALGCKVNWGTDEQLPFISEHFKLENISHHKSLSIINHKYTDSLLATIQLLKNTYKNRVPVIGKVIGPLTLAYLLYGTEAIQLAYILEPQLLNDVMNDLVLVSMNFAQKQIDAGADILTWADHGTRDLLSVKGYEELLLPLQQKASHKLTSEVPIILHICGNIEDRVNVIMKTGFQCFHIDSRNNIRKVASEMNGKMLITGAVNNPKTLYYGSRKDIQQEVDDLIDAGVQLISPECAIPCSVRNESLKTLVRRAHSRHPNYT